MTDKEKLKKAISALKLARSVMTYASGDAWEREVTKKDRDQIDKICEELQI
jgi:hypothetical protein